MASPCRLYLAASLAPTRVRGGREASAARSRMPDSKPWILRTDAPGCPAAVSSASHALHGAVLDRGQRGFRPPREDMDGGHALVPRPRRRLEAELACQPLLCDDADGDLRAVRVDIVASAYGGDNRVEPLLGVDLAGGVASVLTPVGVVVPRSPARAECWGVGPEANVWRRARSTILTWQAVSESRVPWVPSHAA